MRPSEYPYDLGTKHYDDTLRMLTFSVSPAIEEDKKADYLFWLQNGLIWSYNFHHEESIECFRRALAINPQSAMAHWGKSCSNGPNYNAPCMNRDSFPSASDAYHHAKEAGRLAALPEIRSTLSEVEVDLIQALQCRFNPIEGIEALQVEQNASLYADALKIVYEKHPLVPCVVCAYAEALMNFAPWKLWDLDTGTPLGRTPEIRALLEEGLALAPSHPGMNHFYIHLMEMSAEPAVALPSCATLRTVCPDAGHLVHMPSHIYALLGMWEEAVQSNEEGHRGDEIYRAQAGLMNSYTGYRLHNIHFICYAAMMVGQYKVALSGARRLHENLPERVVSDPALGPFFEAFCSVDMHVMIRFGKWEDILSTSIPANPKVWPYRTATVRYARGITHAITGDVKAAREELAYFRAAAVEMPGTYTLHNNLCVDTLQVAEAMLVGELEYRAGNMKVAFDNLRRAVDLCDQLNYDEPWGWMQPPRHALGALLLEQGDVEEAEAVFRKDMDSTYYGRCHPDNVWALTGLAACLGQRLDCSRGCAAKRITEELKEIDRKLAVLKRSADVDIEVACMCAGMAPCEDNRSCKRRKCHETPKAPCGGGSCGR